MPIILVVDDSQTERRLIGGLVQKDLDWIIEYADNGQTALEMIEHTSPDVVVTDLQMPRLDGIQLVQATKKKFPQTPVVIVTSQGSESIAVEALKAGATSYVAKANMAESLLPTIEQVLALAQHDESCERLTRCLTNTRFQFRLENDPQLIGPLLEFVNQRLKDMGVGDTAQRRQACVALEEALLNAMLHGNLELPAMEVTGLRRGLHDGKRLEIVDHRCALPPYNVRRVLFGMDVTAQRVQFVVRDAGRGFDTAAARRAVEPTSMAAAPTRGLNLIRTLMQQVDFSDTGNEIRMTFQPSPPAATT